MAIMRLSPMSANDYIRWESESQTQLVTIIEVRYPILCTREHTTHGYALCCFASESRKQKGKSYIERWQDTDGNAHVLLRQPEC